MLNPVPDIPRYTSIGLPPHRFLPGDSVPAAIPELPGPARLTEPDDWRDCTGYLYGCDLYNHGYWWESHEVWEDLWHQTAHRPEPRLQRSFLQGLIQIAACAIKLEQGKQRGLRMLLKTSDAHLRKVIEHVGDDRFMGLPVRSWLDEVERYYGCATQHDERIPLIRLAE